MEYMTYSNRMKHIRAKGAMRSDKRFRFAFGDRGEHSRNVFNRNGTICGADPTPDDHDRATAAHLIKSAAVAPDKIGHWASDICPACRGGL